MRSMALLSGGTLFALLEVARLDHLLRL